MKGNQTIQKMFQISKTYLNRNSSTILTVIGAIGVVATTVMAVKATPKVTKLLEEASDEKQDELTKLEVIRLAGPAYIPSILVGASTIACIFGANALNKRQQASLTSACVLAGNTYKEYRQKVKEMFGEETDVQIRDAILKDKRDEDIVAYTPGLGTLDTSGEKQLFYDEFGKRYFEATMNEVINAEYHLNRNFALRGSSNVNEFYEFLGLDKTDFGDVLGWSACEFMEGGLMPWLDFDHRIVRIEDGSKAGLECCVISFVFEPSSDYCKYDM